MEIEFYGFQNGELTLIKKDKVKAGMKLQFHGGIMEKWCHEIRFK